MHQLINKKLKIFFYVVILLLFSTFININFHDFISNFFSIKKINIYGVNGQKKEKILEIFAEIIQDLKNYELEKRISELESKFSEDMSENIFNEIKELKKQQKIN